LALELHPDKNKDISATEKFKEISSAYDILKNKVEKSKYDEYLANKESSGRYS
jgi:DnaJ-class molecular chaperone